MKITKLLKRFGSFPLPKYPSEYPFGILEWHIWYLNESYKTVKKSWLFASPQTAIWIPILHFSIKHRISKWKLIGELCFTVSFYICRFPMWTCVTKYEICWKRRKWYRSKRMWVAIFEWFANITSEKMFHATAPCALMDARTSYVSLRLSISSL